MSDLSLLLKWEGSSGTLKPMLLMAHIDIVSPCNPTSPSSHPACPCHGGLRAHVKTQLFADLTTSNNQPYDDVPLCVHKMLMRVRRCLQTIQTRLFGHTRHLGVLWLKMASSMAADPWTSRACSPESWKPSSSCSRTGPLLPLAPHHAHAPYSGRYHQLVACTQVKIGRHGSKYACLTWTQPQAGEDCVPGFRPR